MIVNLSRRVGALASLSHFGAIALGHHRIKGKSKIFANARRLLFVRRYTPLQKKIASYLYTLIYLKVTRIKIGKEIKRGGLQFIFRLQLQ